MRSRAGVFWDPPARRVQARLCRQVLTVGRPRRQAGAIEAGGEELDGRKRRPLGRLGNGDWITVVTRPPGRSPERWFSQRQGDRLDRKAFDVEFGQTTEWDGDRLIIISAFWYAVVQAKQIERGKVSRARH
jgi:hypothetical protein